MKIEINFRTSNQKYYSSEINQDEPMASSQLVEVLLSFMNTINQICI